ncbi:MAG: Haloacid dehalogenase superfamily, subfamily IA, variant 3 [candidate division TM6 bacterium GW2011_GWF2_28_16]|nr:MAG: Haloacid dehalogenase superfamily, subfamily IA, variant 3 [candidate division TM6 bacterium GW2011_GWF2_28_16]
MNKLILNKFLFCIALLLNFLVVSVCSNIKVEEKGKNISTIIFDFDGTIADTLPLCIKCINTFAKEYNYAPSNNIEYFRNKTLEDVIKNDLKLHFYQLPSYGEKLKKMISEQKESIKVFVAINDLITELSKNYKIGIITSNNQEVVETVLEKSNIKNISFIFSSNDHSTIKKIIYGKSGVITSFLKKNNLNQDQVLYIGDEVRDIQACRKAGVKMAAVTWGYNSKELLEKEKPDYLVDKPLEILKILSNRE